MLDFGLAKAMDPTAASGAGRASQLTASPTLSLGATVQGVILGTAAYMAPEQARGGAVDKRADVWAFGVVLWEMVTGRRLFGGDTVPDTLARVLQGGIDLEAVPEATRITSYNVCYTKLLRTVSGEHGSFFKLFAYKTKAMLE